MATPQPRPQRWYLHSGGGASSRPSDGSLSMVAPTMEPVDSFNCGTATHELMPSSEMLSYASPVFIEPLVVKGTVVAELYAVSSSVDTEFTTTLVDVGPDRRDTVITFVAGSSAAVDATHIAIDFGELAHTFDIGHRLRVDIGASNRGGLAAQQVFHDAVRPSCVALPTS
jgi:predicted acyl esterase